jgi:hypothetical protein
MAKTYNWTLNRWQNRWEQGQRRNDRIVRVVLYRRKALAEWETFLTQKASDMK